MNVMNFSKLKALSAVYLTLVLFIGATLTTAPAQAIDFELGEAVTLLDFRSAWLPTGPNNSLERDSTLFSFVGRPGSANVRYRTFSEETNIHSHFRAGSQVLANYVYTGEMRIAEPNGGIGVTFHSTYPREDEYYRLRALNGSTFHIWAHPDSVFNINGDVDTLVVPEADSWYKFKILVRTRRDETQIRAKVWKLGDPQPADWQVNCSHLEDNRIRRGKPGVWSMGPGEKSWRRLMVTPK